MTKPSPSRVRLSALLGGALVCAGALTFGCLERPVVPSEPNTSNVFVQQIQNTAIDKIDLLFVIDNSASMADKQSILENAVPQMVTRLVTPDCVTRTDGVVDQASRAPSTAAAAPGGKPSCPNGKSLEFNPVNDIHIGVITSSLGGHGSESCKRDGKNDDDKGYLLPKAPASTGDGARGALPTPGDTGFLVWYPVAKADQDPARPIEGDIAKLTADFKAQVVAVGEFGCGFEAPLEAWYRFLVDPSPPASMVRDTATGKSASTGVDPAIAAQRAAFLRPDSLVAIIVLTDENDCSAMDGGPYYPFASFGWLVSHTLADGATQQNPVPFFLPVATDICETNPNDACCFSCLLDKAPAGCADTSAIAKCAPVAPSTSAPKQIAENDRANSRCYQNKRRFGIDLLYPTERYVSGLKNTKIVDSQTGEETFNPLLTGVDGTTPRNASFVFFAGIVGVPWQDIATPDSIGNDTTLRYLTAKELAEDNVVVGANTVDRWAVILGDKFQASASKICREDPENAACGRAPTPPLDPFMIESINPRAAGTNPIDPTIAITAAGTFNAINGHEYNNGAPKSASDATPANDDLQYSCIFPLTPFDGVRADCLPTDSACDCGDEGTVSGKDRPLCRLTATAAAGTTQYWGKAYPATRVLQVLKDFGENSIVASICPKVSSPNTSPSFGYNPAVGAIVDRLAEKLGGQCLPRALTVDTETNSVPCTVVEALAPKFGAVTCDETEGRKVLGDKIAPAVLKQLKETEICKTDAECEAYSLCEVVQQVAGTPKGDACLTNTAESSTLPDKGYCYIDPSQGLGSEALVSTCSATQKRILRFVGEGVPRNNSVTFVACTADAVQEETVTPAGGGAGG